MIPNLEKIKKIASNLRKLANSGAEISQPTDAEHAIIDAGLGGSPTIDQKSNKPMDANLKPKLLDAIMPVIQKASDANQSATFDILMTTDTNCNITYSLKVTSGNLSPAFQKEILNILDRNYKPAQKAALNAKKIKTLPESHTFIWASEVGF